MAIFLGRIRRQPSSQRRFSNSWARDHETLWQKFLGHFGARDDVHALEIGSFEGQSACWFLDHILTGKRSTLTCVDTWPNQHVEKAFDFNTRGYANRLSKIRSSSQGFMCRRIGNGRRELYNWIYVDGDHRAGACLMDAVLAWPLLARNGIILFDDCGKGFARRKPTGTVLPRDAVRAFLSVTAEHAVLYDAEQIIVQKL